MHIRDREFDPFAFRINDSALPEAVDGYVFQTTQQDRNFPLTAELERSNSTGTALENGFGKQVIYGYENVLKTRNRVMQISATSVDAISMWI